ncbi:HAD family hydrolase [Micromonospora sp. SH-82]|uniref:HAD family hydrolase n=1 Tax=Micromonospora sp. SH-82 TaxID=3132938 RepID=UPI003EB9F5E2
MLPPPRALLLDFGGVLADAPARNTAEPELVRRVDEVTRGEVGTERIRKDLDAGVRAYAAWRDDVGNTERSVEMGHAQVFRDFVTVDWPSAARAAVEREATPLAYAWTWRSGWAVRPGVPEALRAARAAGLPMAVVSNTLCGAAHRDFLDRAGLTHLFAAQFYSDEAGPRKPNPELALLAARAIGVPIGGCWFVGDSVHRDVRCARRAGTAAVVLMRSARTDRESPLPDALPDARIEDGHGLVDLLGEALGERRGR